MRLALPSSAENVALVRRAIRGLADAAGLERSQSDDIGTAVTEACNNASQHAYPAGSGPLEVEFLVGSAATAVTVRDHGAGVPVNAHARRKFPDGDEAPEGGFGLPTINALADDASWSEPAGGGTVVEMHFATEPRHARRLGPGCDLSRTDGVGGRDRAGALEVAMAPLSVARSVLPRVLDAMAGGAHFSREGHVSLQRICFFLLADPSLDANAVGVQARVVIDEGELELALGSADGGDFHPLDDAMRHLERELDTSAVRLRGGARGLKVRVER